MDDIDNSKKSRERKKEEHLNEIAVAIQSYLRKYQITTGQYVSQENHLKEIEVRVSIGENSMSFNDFVPFFRHKFGLA